MAEPAITAVGLCKAWPGVTAVDGVDLEIARGQAVAIMGPSGSGKSTLLQLIGGLDRPTSGSVRVTGRIGFLFQQDHLLSALTAAENVQIPLLALRRPAAERRQRAQELLELVGLSHRADVRPGRLSGGERQRVALARAVASHPAVVLADEPTGDLDRATSQRVVDLLLGLRTDEGVTLLVATHDPAVAARMDRVLVLVDGRLQPTPEGT